MLYVLCNTNVTPHAEPQAHDHRSWLHSPSSLHVFCRHKIMTHNNIHTLERRTALWFPTRPGSQAVWNAKDISLIDFLTVRRTSCRLASACLPSPHGEEAHPLPQTPHACVPSLGTPVIKAFEALWKRISAQPATTRQPKYHCGLRPKQPTLPWRTPPESHKLAHWLI
jgi:hypothetical protein